MHFLTPAFLALAALAIPIILLYMLRLRRRETPVSSTLLWQRLVRDREANTPWQKLRRNLLLLLQLLILLALVLALIRPFLPVASAARGSVVLLMDASASMLADDMPGGRTRFQAAQEQAVTMADELAAGDTMTVIAVGPTPRVLAAATDDRVALHQAVRAAEPIAASADWEAALALAGASVAGASESTIVILSDGGLPENLPPVTGEVRYFQVGAAGDNLAISALAARPAPDSNAPQLFAAVTNYGEADADIILSLEADGALITAERLALPAGGTINRTLTDVPPEARVFRAALTRPADSTTPDYLSADDQAYAVHVPSPGGRVLLVTEGNLFLEQVLLALPDVESYRAAPGELPEEDYDLVILDGWMPDPLPETNLLIIAPSQSTALFDVTGPFAETGFVGQVADTLLDYVDFDQVAILEAQRVENAPWARALVTAEGGPLLLAGEQDGRRIAILTFDLHDSDLPLQLAFPILMTNLMAWYAPAEIVDAPDGLVTGQPLTIRPRAEADACRVTRPDGVQETLALEETQTLYTDTLLPGVYGVELLAGEGVMAEQEVAVNLFAPEESAITPAETITLGEAAVPQGAGAEAEGQRELWPWVAGAARVILLVEWWVYHRGSALPRVGRIDRRKSQG
jgi:Ca-activated chloride channel family protein